MSWKSKISPESRIRLLMALGPLSSLAFILSVILSRLQNPNLDFLSGFLIGFAIVGNMAFVYVTTRYMRNT